MEFLVGKLFLGLEVGVLHLSLFYYVANGHNVIRNFATRPGYGSGQYLIAVCAIQMKCVIMLWATVRARD